jgi:hypothetical protein
MRKKGSRALLADFTHAYSMLTVTGNAECLANMAFELIECQFVQDYLHMYSVEGRLCTVCAHHTAGWTMF